MTAEAEILRNLAADLKSEGYDVVIAPPPSALPPALKELEPDAIAIGREPKLVIEVTAAGPLAVARVRSIREAVDQESGWALRVVYSSRTPEPTLEVATPHRLNSTFDVISGLGKIDTRAAMLAGWAVLEAVARSLSPTDFAKPQTPGRIVERFSATGQFRREEGAFLRELITKRNSFIHGDMSIVVEEGDLARFMKIIRRQLNELERRQKHGTI